MSGFKSYIHVERLDKDEVLGILEGTCYLTFKLDGTNACVWGDEDGNIHCGSRTREITIENDNAGFAAWMASEGEEQTKLCRLCVNFPHVILYGEWGVGKVGSIKQYEQDARNHFHIFDIYNRELERYLNWDEMEACLTLAGLLDYRIPLVAKLESPTLDQITELAENNKYLLEDTDTIGEGIVIKRYNFMNKYGRYGVAKFVRDGFRNDGIKKRRIALPGEVEKDFVERYLTAAELNKAKAKICLACGAEEFEPSGRMIGMFMNLVVKDTIEENIMDFLKKQKDPVIDFKALTYLIKTDCRKYLGLM